MSHLLGILRRACGVLLGFSYVGCVCGGVGEGVSFNSCSYSSCNSNTLRG